MKSYFKAMNVIRKFRTDMMARQQRFQKEYTRNNDALIEMLVQDAGFDFGRLSIVHVLNYLNPIESRREKGIFYEKVVRGMFPKEWTDKYDTIAMKAIAGMGNDILAAKETISGRNPLNIPHTFVMFSEIHTRGGEWFSDDKSDGEMFFDILGGTPEQYDKACDMMTGILRFAMSFEYAEKYLQETLL